MELKERLAERVKQPSENEWLEFKHNYHSAKKIGEYISALSNAACLHGREFGYLVFGFEDATHRVIGTAFKAKTGRVKKDDLTHWLAQRLRPRIDFEVEEFDYNGKHISMYIIPATGNQPVEFMQQAHIRVASNNRKLDDFPEKARKIWKKEPTQKFENGLLSAVDEARKLCLIVKSRIPVTIQN